MPIRGDRLRWPPRPGKKNVDNGTRRTLATDERSTEQPLRGPAERDESANTPALPRPVVTQALDDIKSGQQDTDLYGRGARADHDAKSGAPRRER